jgi:hypothetical protein
VRRLQPAASEADPLLADVNRLAPQFDGFFAVLDDVVASSKRGLPALDRVIAGVPPLLAAFQPVLRNVNPLVEYIAKNKREVTAFFANVTAASQIRDMTPYGLHFLRTSQTLNPEAATYYPRPIGMTRLNPYMAPGTMTRIPTGLPVLDKNICGYQNPLPPATFGSANLSELFTTFGFRTEGRDVAAPACTEQGPYPGTSATYPQLRAEP